MQTFFKRLLQVIENQGFKNINDFALNGLNYDSSSKLNRLKDDKNKPSIEIINDISNKFEEINIHWLITGKGEMLIKSGNSLVNEVSVPSSKYVARENYEMLEQNYAALKENQTIKDDIIAMQKIKIAMLQDTLNNESSLIQNMIERVGSLEEFKEALKLKYQVEQKIEQVEKEIKTESVSRKTN